MDRRATIAALVRCPDCHGILAHESDGFTCRACHLNFQDHEGVPILVKGMMILPSDESMENRFKNFFKQWPGLYRVLFTVVGPALLTGLTSKKFAARFGPATKILHAGSGTLKIGDHAINVDVFPLTGVDVAADLRALPFADNSFDAATSEQVLEHVPQPWKAAAEIERVVKPGGQIHLALPFIFPWHPSPSDYTRWTFEGMADLFPHCTVVEKGIAAGPCSAFTAFMAAFLATILSFGIRPLQGILQYVFLVLLIPVKLLDLIFARFPGAELCSAELWVVLRKEK